MVTFPAARWTRIGCALFTAAGATESNAARVTAALVDSSLAGHDSHGVIRLVQYLKAIQEGQLDPAGQPRILKEMAGASLVDGAWTFGQVGAEICMKRAISQAKVQGIALSALIRAYHIGRLGEYSEMAHDAGMIGMVLAGGFGGAGASSMTGVAPFGGAAGALGTNPISFGVPAGERPPVMVDFATSAVAGGKIALARARGVSLPPGYILDREGRPSTNPEDFYAGGTLQPFGAHKGYGLSVVIELLGQALTGSDRCDEKKLGGAGAYTRAGSLFIAIDTGLFRPSEDFAAAADATIRRIKSVPPAPGFDEVLLPGEPEQRSKAKRSTEGISLPDSSWEILLQLAASYGVDLEGPAPR